MIYTTTDHSQTSIPDLQCKNSKQVFLLQPGISKQTQKETEQHETLTVKKVLEKMGLIKI